MHQVQGLSRSLGNFAHSSQPIDRSWGDETIGIHNHNCVWWIELEMAYAKIQGIPLPAPHQIGAHDDFPALCSHHGGGVVRAVIRDNYETVGFAKLRND
jgi:hypothetical protein